MTPDRYVVSIPSYKRAATLRDKTLAYLAKTDVDPSRIVVFVADEQQLVEYVETLQPGTFGSIVVAVPGMGAVRNYMQWYWSKGQPVFYLDDDIVELRRRVSEKKAVPLLDGLDDLIQFGFRATADAGVRLWGIYPVLNPMFMKDRLNWGLTYIVGCCYGVWNSHNADRRVKLDDKEDFERSLRYYDADNGMLRIEYVAPKTNYYGEPGGMQEERTPERVTESAIKLQGWYPDLCRLTTSRSRGTTELRLRDSTTKGKPRLQVTGVEGML